MDALCILPADFILEYLFVDFISAKSICQAEMLKAICILTRKSSKTGACARLAAFSCQNTDFLVPARSAPTLHRPPGMNVAEPLAGTLSGGQAGEPGGSHTPGVN